MSDNSYIYGRNAVIEALTSGKAIEKIFLSYGVQGASINKIYTLAKKAGVKVVKHDQNKFKDLEKKIGIFARHSQGAIALKEMISFVDPEILFHRALKASDYPVIVALDSIEDPQNLGAIARSIECSGAFGILMSERNSAPVTPASVKTSAGALEYLPVAKAGNLSQSLEKAKELGFWVIGSEMNAQNSYTDNIYDRPILLVIGNEGKGIRPSVLKHCDIKIKIPMNGKIESLNASVSAGIILFEIARQQS